MKKITSILAIALLLIACGGSGKSNASSGIEWKEGGLCAVLFLGYGKKFATISQTNDFKEFCKRFPALQKATAFTAETEGDEVYYIIPRHSDATVTVHEYKFDIEAMKETIGKELYRGFRTHTYSLQPQRHASEYICYGYRKRKKCYL